MGKTVERYVGFEKKFTDEPHVRFCVEKEHATITTFLTEFVKLYPEEVRESPWIRVYVTEFTVGNPPNREPWRHYEYIAVLSGNIWHDGLLQTNMGENLHKLPQGYELFVEGVCPDFRTYFRKKLN